jgi:hypothetical protein
MAVKLGNTTASLYLGSTPVAAYLGATQVYSVVQAATLYFNNAEEDYDWATVGNWWLDDEHTAPAGRLPTSADSVVISQELGLNSGDPITVLNLTVDNALFETSATVTGLALFVNGATNNGTVTGNATFNDSSYNAGGVSGTATFNDSSNNTGTVDGDATFTGSACNSGTVTGTITGNPPSCFDD